MWQMTQLRLLKIVAAGLLILMGLSADAQQDTQFTQFIFNGLSINPAYAGYKEDLFVQATYRSQWQGLTGAPKSFSISADGTLSDKNVGLGLVVTNDHIGAQRYLSAFANYAYRLPLNYDGNQRLAFGIGVGLTQIGIDGNELQAIQGGDALVPTGLQSERLPDARFGIYYADDNFFAGISATNMLAKYFADENQTTILAPVPQPHYFFTAGTMITLNSDFKLKPVVLLKEDTKAPGSLDLSTFLLMKERLWIGLFYRSSVNFLPKSNLQSGLPKENAMGAIVQIFTSSKFRIGYSYDYSLSGLGSYNYGSHELSIGIYLNDRRNDGNRRLRCYDF